ncbi:MAG: PAS domain S-box protein [Deltaproteobacteria bacterium]|nr:MAG: PAS domain S-box protein [Deltaproteobacteria bacterium]
MDFSVPMTGSRYEDFQKGASHLRFDPSIKRVKVWNPDSVIVWSDERELVGKQFPNNKELLEALNGVVSSEISSLTKEENRTERQQGRLLELYIPIRSEGGGNVRAVVEIYQDLGYLDADTSRQKRILWISIFAGFTAIYFACFGIVWRASRRLTEQTLEIEKSEEKNRDLAQKLTSLINNLPGIVYRGHRDWSLSFIGAEVEPVTGYTPDDFISGTVGWKEIIHPDDLEQVKETFRKAEKEKTDTLRVEYRIRNKFGGIRWIEDRRQLIYGESGAVDEVDGLLLDITERKRSEEARARLGMAVDQAAEEVVITDTEGRIEYVNPSFERMTGYLGKEAVGQNMRILKSGKQDEMFYRNMWESISRGEVWRGNFINKKKDGTLYDEEAIISPVRSASGKIINFVAGKRDITDEIRLQKQVQTAQRMDSVGTLAGGIAHDFNNALTGILGVAELLRLSVGENPDVSKNLDLLETCARQATTLTRQLLTFARRQVIDPVNLDLNVVVSETASLVRKVIGEHIEVETSLDKGLPTARLDRGQVEQVIMNLCLNARDAMPSGGRILLETADSTLDHEGVHVYPYMTPGRYARLTVSDTGTGMDKETLGKVFEPFFTTKPVGKGTGLGLSSVYGIVKQSGGFIHAYSEPGNGSSFKIYFPAVEAPPDVVPDKRREEAVHGGTETILLAEDEESLRGLAERILAELGYTVHVARDGEEAIEVLNREENIDLAILDMVMPRKGGKEAYEEMRNRNPNLKALFMSGYSADAMHESFVLIPGTPFLPKPFTPSALARKVREVLDKA